MNKITLPNWLYLALAAMLLSLALVSCQKPVINILVKVKADNYWLGDHNEVRMSYAFIISDTPYTPTDSTIVRLTYNQKHYTVNLPASEATGYVLPGIPIGPTEAVSTPIIEGVYNRAVVIGY